VTETGETVYGDFEDYNFTFDDDIETFVAGGVSPPVLTWDSSEQALSIGETTNGGATKTADIWADGRKTRFSARVKKTSTGSVTVRIRTSATWLYTDLGRSSNLSSTGGNSGYFIVLSDDEWHDIWFEAETISTTSSSLYVQLLLGGIKIDDIVITELDTYRTLDVAYHNPVVRLRRDSDNIHKSFPAGAFTQMLNWANEDVVQYSSDFSADVDGWTTQINAVCDTVDDPIDSGTNVLRILASAVLQTHQISRNFTYPTFDGVSVNLSGEYYIPNGNTQADSIQVLSHTTNVETLTTKGSWVSFSVDVTPEDAFQRFRVDSTANTNSEYVYLRNLSFTQLTSNAYATTWYDQSGVQVESVFNDTDCSTANGWAQAGNATLTVNYDSGDEGHESVFRLESGDGIAERIQLDDTYTDGTVYRVSFDHRYVTNNATKGRIFVTATQYGDITPSATWTRHELIWTQVGAGTSLRLYIDNNDGDASDEWLFDNIKVEVLDKAHNDATQTTADNQPKVVDAGALVTDANGNYSLDFDGVDDSLVVANLVNEFENTDFQLTAVGSNVYAGLVSGSVPRLYFRDTAYSYDALSIITYTNPSLAIQTWECVGSAHEVFHDGSSVGTATQAQTAFGPTDFAIGQSAAAYRYTNISALLFYPTDQSANREAIEQSLSKILTTALS